jgi:hypothetical protein
MSMLDPYGQVVEIEALTPGESALLASQAIHRLAVRPVLATPAEFVDSFEDVLEQAKRDCEAESRQFLSGYRGILIVRPPGGAYTYLLARDEAELRKRFLPLGYTPVAAFVAHNGEWLRRDEWMPEI